jgi:hypothetical protein
MPSKTQPTGPTAGKLPTSAKRPQPKGGSRKGRPNKSTAAAREAIAVFVDGNVERLQEWLDRIAVQNGALAAFKCFTELLEYHVPKLARTEHVGAHGGPTEEVVAVVQGLSIEQLRLLASIPLRPVGAIRLPGEDR